jgi:hypothetical protein
LLFYFTAKTQHQRRVLGNHAKPELIVAQVKIV